MRSTVENKIKIALVDDHLLVRNGIRTLLEQEQDLEVIDEGSNGLEAIEIVKNNTPDVLIIDVRMPEMNGIEAVHEIAKLNSKTKAIVLSMHDSEQYILQSIKAGAYGYLLKDTDRKEFVKAIHTVQRGEKYFSGDISNIIVANMLNPDQGNANVSEANQKDPFGLTRKEHQILKMVLSGKTNTQIAEYLQNSKRTIETHRFNLMKKMQVKNLMELAAKARAHGLHE